MAAAWARTWGRPATVRRAEPRVARAAGNFASPGRVSTPGPDARASDRRRGEGICGLEIAGAQGAAATRHAPAVGRVCAVLGGAHGLNRRGRAATLHGSGTAGTHRSLRGPAQAR